MDSQFTTLTRSYHDNYLQYTLTGNESYQTAYEAAKTGLDNIISSLESEVADQESVISNFYKSDVEGKMRDLKSGILDTKRLGVSIQDQHTASKMREVPQSVNLTSANYTPYYVTAGVLIVFSVVLNML
jgi:type VII secretion effector (TIGR04197 family)